MAGTQPRPHPWLGVFLCIITNFRFRAISERVLDKQYAHVKLQKASKGVWVGAGVLAASD